MSAVFGLINLDGRPVRITDMELMSTALAPYGPDAQGAWIQGAVGLGQRLMCFTPEDRLERQPARSNDAQHVLVSDARIDNRPELQHELGIPALEARTLPDSAFILRAYEKWGIECASHLVGAFAFALYDLRTRSMLLARSAMAERSFFYYQTPGVFAFASAPKGLFALPFVPRTVDRQSIADFLALHLNEQGSSYFSRVHRIQAGHLIVIQDGNVKSRQYRAVNTGGEIRFQRDTQYVEAFNSLLDRVVADNLRSLTPVGVWLSGGLDSTTIAAAAAMQLRQDNQTLHAFTAVPAVGFSEAPVKGWYADETPFVNAMARKYANLDLQFIRADGFYMDDLDSFFESAESPIVGATHLPWVRSLQQQARKENVRVLLNGTPGNFTISYDGHRLLAELISKFRLGEALHEARPLADSPRMTSIARIVIALGLMPLLPDRLWLASRDLRSWMFADGRTIRPWQTTSAINSEFANKYGVENRFRESVHCLRSPAGPAGRAELILRRADRRGDARRGEESLYGIQNRDLPADLRLVEFCLSIPENQYLRNGTSRWLIRRAGVERLPEDVRNNSKRGIQAAGWFEALKSGQSRLFDELKRLEGSALASEILDLKRLRALVERIPSVMDNSNRTRDFRVVLEHGIAMGRFLVWAESGG